MKGYFSERITDSYFEFKYIDPKTDEITKVGIKLWKMVKKVRFAKNLVR